MTARAESRTLGKRGDTTGGGRLASMIPATEWLRTYNWQRDLMPDLTAGFVVTVMLIPQSLAMALLAGLPPIYGLYAATVPPLIYAIFGTSRHLSVGPMAITSLLTFAGVSQLADQGTSEYLKLALLLMLMVGVMQIALGLLRAGFAVKFFSNGVVSGFTSAAAIIIAFSQVDELLGIEVSSSDTVLASAVDIVRNVDSAHLPTALLGLGGIAVMVAYRRIVPHLPTHLLLVASKLPITLFLVAGGTVIVWLFGLNSDGVQIVGSIPRGLPKPAAPAFDTGAMQSLAPAALTISFIGYMGSISIARTIAAREKAKVRPNQEFHALGLSNVAGSFFSGFPVTGSFSRTAVNYQSGARTQLSGVFTAVLVILTLLVLTPLFYYLPTTILAAIIIVAVSGLVNFRDMRYYLTIRRTDGASLVLTFLATLALGVEYGILVGLAFSLLVVIWRSSDPHAVEVGYLESQGTFRNLDRHPEASVYEETVIIRIDAPLYFANMERLEEQIENAASARPNLSWIVLDFSGVADIDAVAVQTFEDMIISYRAAGVRIVMAGIKGHVYDVLVRAGWRDKFPEVTRYPSIQLALESLGLMSRYTSTGELHRIGIFGTKPMADILPASSPDE